MNIVQYVKKLALAIGFDPDTGDLVLTSGKKLKDEAGTAGKSLINVDGRAYVEGWGGAAVGEMELYASDHNSWINFNANVPLHFTKRPGETWPADFRCFWVQGGGSSVEFEDDDFSNYGNKLFSLGPGSMGWIYSPDGVVFYVSGDTQTA